MKRETFFYLDLFRKNRVEIFLRPTECARYDGVVRFIPRFLVLLPLVNENDFFT